MTTQRQSTRKLTAIDLFCGCGGLTAGLKIAGYKVLSAIELDPKACETYALNHPEVSLVEGDIRNVSPEDLMRDLGLRRGDLDLLAGCPPCQGFSRIRKRNKSHSARDSRNALIDEFGRFVLTFRPKLIMMENVPGLLDYYRFKNFRALLEAEGYQVELKILDVADFGVPQRRKRLIISASRLGYPIMARPFSKRRTVRDAIGKMPVAGLSGDALHDFPEKRSDKIKDLIKAVPKNGGSRSQLPAKFALACHQRSDGFSDVYGRMSWDDVAPTITSGCINPSKGRFLHPTENRTITLREASILQGFSVRYRFNIQHGKECIALMIGNALPPPFIAAQAKALANTIIEKS